MSLAYRPILGASMQSRVRFFNQHCSAILGESLHILLHQQLESDFLVIFRVLRIDFRIL